MAFMRNVIMMITLKMIMGIDNEDKCTQIHKIYLHSGSRYPIKRERIEDHFDITLRQGRDS